MKEWTFDDKSKWGDGPWQSESDKAQWVDEATGLDCLIHRGPVGALCGYVGVTEGHPFFGVNYGDCSKGLKGSDGEPERYCDHAPEAVVRVHGGLTYSNLCNETKTEDGSGVCHVPEPGRPEKVWWFGFDCAHHMDLCPKYRDLYPKYREHGFYRDFDYVKGQCGELAAQLAKIGPERVPSPVT